MGAYYHMKYLDGFVFVVPKNNLAKYKKMAKDAARIWKKFLLFIS